MKNKEIKKEVAKYCKKWINRLGLHGWHIDIHYDDSKPGISASTYPQWEYMLATITFYPNEINTVKNPYIEALVIHELMHVMLSQMNETPTTGNVNKHEERVATIFENAFLINNGKKR